MSKEFFQFYEKVETEDKGIAIRALVDMELGCLVGKFSGEIVSEITQHSIELEPGKHIIDLEFIGYMAHSCDPNCTILSDSRSVYALKNIKAGELLTVDYSLTESKLFKDFDCLCGSAECRKHIIGNADMPKEERVKFMFSKLKQCSDLSIKHATEELARVEALLLEDPENDELLVSKLKCMKLLALSKMFVVPNLSFDEICSLLI